MDEVHTYLLIFLVHKHAVTSVITDAAEQIVCLIDAYWSICLFLTCENSARRVYRVLNTKHSVPLETLGTSVTYK